MSESVKLYQEHEFEVVCWNVKESKKCPNPKGKGPSLLILEGEAPVYQYLMVLAVAILESKANVIAYNDEGRLVVIYTVGPYRFVPIGSIIVRLRPYVV